MSQSSCSSSSSEGLASLNTADNYLQVSKVHLACLQEELELELKGERTLCNPTDQTSLLKSKETSSSSPRTRSTLLSPTLSNLLSSSSSQPPVESAATDGSTTCSFLTNEILAIGDKARDVYETIRAEHYCPDEDLLSHHIPFSSFSIEQLEVYFSAAVDAKNALSLRRFVVAVDILNALENLLPKLSLYQQDGAVLSSLSGEIRVINQHCSQKKLPVDLYSLEFMRLPHPLIGRSVLEQHSTLFYNVKQRLDSRRDAEEVAHQFISDPSSLTEHRIPYFLTSQR